jgi:hypothetical protein
MGVVELARLRVVGTSRDAAPLDQLDGRILFNQ